MYVFTARSIGNEPELYIHGQSVDHVLKSRFFNVYTYDKKFDVTVSSHEGTKLVKIRAKTETDPDAGALIGYLNKA